MAKYIHIVGICGTFMAGVAVLAKELGFKVAGSDLKAYPPMSTQLEQTGIEVFAGYSEKNLVPTPDLVVIGNALSRGNPEVEAVLNQRLNYTSGANWLKDFVLKNQWVLAVSGTHGKTTTAAMLAWILDYAGIDTGFLIGGVAQNFGISARLGSSDFFVIEADEYDTAFFDKRSKFVHYRPQTLLINNLEFDHADIFKDLAAIQTQFHHLVRTVPSNGLIVHPKNSPHITKVLGGWTRTETINGQWNFKLLMDDASRFEVILDGEVQGEINWDLIGLHNVTNALGAISMARHAGVPVSFSIEAMLKFKAPKKRMELKGECGGVKVYDDFAHHPTAIASTLHGLRAKVGGRRIIAVLELRSNTMKMGVHNDQLNKALRLADKVLIYQVEDATCQVICNLQDGKIKVFNSTTDLLKSLTDMVRLKDSVLIMSNGSFANLHERLLTILQNC